MKQAESAREVGVVICTGDRPAPLCRCLAAIAAGAHRPTRVVVVEAGDSSGAAPALTAASDQLDVLHLPLRRSGVSAARNAGAARVGTALVAFTDDDCVPAVDWLQALASGCTDGVDAVTGRILPVADAPGVPTSTRAGTIPRTYSGLDGHSPWEVGSGGNLLVRAEAFRAVGGFDESLGPGTPTKASEDIDFIFRLLRSGATVAYEPGALVYHERKTRQGWLRTRVFYGWGFGMFVRTIPEPSVRRDLLGRYVRERLSAAATIRGQPWAGVGAVSSLAGVLAAITLGRVVLRNRE